MRELTRDPISSSVVVLKARLICRSHDQGTAKRGQDLAHSIQVLATVKGAVRSRPEQQPLRSPSRLEPHREPYRKQIKPRIAAIRISPLAPNRLEVDALCHRDLAVDEQSGASGVYRPADARQGRRSKFAR